MRLPFIVAVSGIAISAILCVLLFRGEASVKDAEMRGYADRLQTRIDAQISVLYSVRAFVESSQTVTRDELRTFIKVADVEALAPGMQGLGYAIAVPPDDATQVRALLLERYGVARDPWPETDQDISYSIVFLEPNDERNIAALGYDMYSEPTRRAAMDTAIRTAMPAATEKVTLVQEIDADVQAGFLIYLPVYRVQGEGIPSGSVKGFVYAPFRARDMFEAALESARLSNLKLTAFIGTYDPENVLFSNQQGYMSNARYVIPVANQEWVLGIGQRASLTSQIFRPSILTLAFGTVLSLLFAGLVRAQREQAMANANLAQEQVDRAEERELTLGEMKHRLKNVIARIQSVASLSASSDPAVQAYVESLTGRLHAMANAQDALTQSRWEKASIGRLVDAELDQLRDRTSEHISATGPDIILEGDQARALALIIHELATNASKYGAVKQQGKLAVRWNKAEEPEVPIVRLEWHESALETAPDLEHTGFGSTLISILLEGQMKGTFSRRVEDGELKVEITFPHTEST